MGSRPRVVVIGAGFAGLQVARHLAGTDVEVTVVDRHNYHTFQPLLYQVATSGLDVSDVAYPVRALFWRAPNVTFRTGVVSGVDWETRMVVVDEADPIPFDYVVIAAGAAVEYFGVESAADWSFPLYTLSDARRLRNHILSCFERAAVDPAGSVGGALTFVVVGGGPTGVEVAGALAELVDTALVRDFADLDASEVKIVLVERGDSVLPAFRERSRRFALAELERRQIEVRLSRSVESLDAHSVRLDSGEVIETETIVWAAGVQASPIVATLDCDRGGGGRISVGDDLAIPGREGAFAAGDVAAVPDRRRGGICPQLAAVAIQSGRHVARQILRLSAGRRTEPFSYRDKGIMATIGRRAAVAEIARGPTLTGTAGWLAWLALHLAYLIGFRNRIVVLVNWAWRYMAWRSGPRLIVDPAGITPPDGT